VGGVLCSLIYEGIRVAEKGMTKRDLEQVFTGLENRMDNKFQGLEERVVNQFHIISVGLVDQIKLLAEGHVGLLERLNHIDERLDKMERENERHHLETRALIKLSFAELDRRLTELETQVPPHATCNSQDLSWQVIVQNYSVPSAVLTGLGHGSLFYNLATGISA
jgi:hypothetical protein